MAPGETGPEAGKAKPATLLSSECSRAEAKEEGPVFSRAVSHVRSHTETEQMR